MNLDDLERIRAIDQSGMLSEIDRLPDQLQAAWELGGRLPLPEVMGVQRVVIAGMGGSAIGGDLVAAYTAPMASVPVTVWRNYDLPAYAAGKSTLVIASSHSGNTEETLAAFERAVENGTQLLAITTGGELARRGEALGVTVWGFQHDGQPRAAVGYSFGMLLSALARIGLIPDPSDEVADAVNSMRGQAEELRAAIPAAHNPAKRMAGQLVGRWPTIMGSGLLAPVARRWRTQIGELAKAIAQFEELPEADHNMVAGVLQPESLVASTMVVFLRAPLDHPRNLLRIETTRNVLMVEGFGTDIIEAHGKSRLAQQWTSLHFGDYTAYYLAIAYGIDPTPVAAIEGLKRQLAQAD